jgi:eukaryotic-like serine/threonine-protein kinase
MNDSENWEHLQALFHLIEMTPTQDRDRVLSEQCPDADLRQRVLEILKASSVESASTPRPSPMQHSKIGPYALIRHLGSGGLGSVYLVERMVGGSAQRAALKVLAPHAAGASFIERFYREEDILASLNHPNITHMFDAGLTETGQPYLVMEYVDGVHLDIYCDDLKLPVAKRIELFLHVCDAVAYAHRNLVIHLDLKPSNILVTPEADVKLLDFGTSKIIQADSLLTTTVLATPAYASPEQLRNEPVTTASDIYALGAILFELLAGRRPGGKASVAIMIERAMREQSPEKVTQAITPEAADLRGVSENRLRQLLSGDLTTIIAKCLSPRPEERYPSIDMLIEDLRRYLDGRPVMARPQTALYRIGKFVRRNRKVVTAAIAACLLLFGALGYAEWQQERALREGQRALRMQTFLYKLFRLANSNYTGKPSATVPEFLQLGVKMLPQYIKDPTDLRQAQMSLAESMFQNGDLDNAQQVFTQTIASAAAAHDFDAEAESEAFSGNIAYAQGQNDLGDKLTAHALDLSHRPKISPATRVWSAIYFAWNRENNGFHSDDNLRLLRYAVKQAHDANLSPHETADAIYDLGEDLEIRGRLDEAEPLYRQALQVYGDDPSALCDRSAVYGDLAELIVMRGDVPRSLPYYQLAYEGAKACAGPDSSLALGDREYIADTMIKLGHAPDALNIMLQDMPTWRKIDGETPGLAEPLYFLAQANVETGHYDQAIAAAREGIDVQTGKIAATDRRFGVFHMIWAQALFAQRHYAEALPHAQLADRLLYTTAISPGAKKVAAHGHQLLADIQAKLPPH